jgi:thiamine-monophosphate kinase
VNSTSDPRLLKDVSEEEILAAIFPLFASGSGVLLGPGDDTALVHAPSGAVLATTDALVRGHDWVDEWSTGADVGRKAVAQNVADIASMGGVPTGLLITLAADRATPLAWVTDFVTGISAGADDAGVPVLGGDLSAAPAGCVMISVTALGDLQGREPVRRSGARVGDVVAVVGTLGHADAGLRLLFAGRGDEAPDLVAMQKAPRPPYEQGPIAAEAGATAMIDLSDGLVRDAGRVARASGVCVSFSGTALRPDVAELATALGEDDARSAVLTGGEEHSLLACFPPDRGLPLGWRVIGEVVAGSGVLLDGVPMTGGGFDHFGG